MKTKNALVAQIKSGLRAWDTQTPSQRVLSLRSWGKSATPKAKFYLKVAEDAIAQGSSLGIAKARASKGQGNSTLKRADPVALVQKALKALEEEDAAEPEQKALIGSTKRNIPEDYLDRLSKVIRLVQNFKQGRVQNKASLNRLLQAVEGNIRFMTSRVADAWDDLDKIAYSKPEGTLNYEQVQMVDRLLQALQAAHTSITRERRALGKSSSAGSAKAAPPKLLDRDVQYLFERLGYTLPNSPHLRLQQSGAKVTVSFTASGGGADDARRTSRELASGLRRLGMLNVQPALGRVLPNGDFELTLTFTMPETGTKTRTAKAAPTPPPGTQEPVRWVLMRMGFDVGYEYSDLGDGLYEIKVYRTGGDEGFARRISADSQRRIKQIPGARILSAKTGPLQGSGHVTKIRFTVPPETYQKAGSAKGELNYLGWPEMTPRRRYLEKRYLDLEKRYNGPVSRDIVRWMQGATEAELLKAIRELK